jgi:hypothetical protein
MVLEYSTKFIGADTRRRYLGTAVPVRVIVRFWLYLAVFSTADSDYI